MTARWVYENGDVASPPRKRLTLRQALAFYNTIYDENQTRTLPPQVELEDYILASHRLCLLIQNAQTAAARRKSFGEKKQRRRRNRCCCFCAKK